MSCPRTPRRRARGRSGRRPTAPSLLRLGRGWRRVLAFGRRRTLARPEQLLHLRLRLPDLVLALLGERLHEALLEGRGGRAVVLRHDVGGYRFKAVLVAILRLVLQGGGPYPHGELRAVELGPEQGRVLQGVDLDAVLAQLGFYEYDRPHCPGQPELQLLLPPPHPHDHWYHRG